MTAHHRDIAFHTQDVRRDQQGGSGLRSVVMWDPASGIKFANNIHTHGGYFMWAPGAYKATGRVTLTAPNIGIENYFFDVANTILSGIKSSRNTVILPQRTGPIADTLYSAAGNSADEQYYKRGIIAYSRRFSIPQVAITAGERSTLGR